MVSIKRMTTAQAIVECLVLEGVRYVFGIFGHGNVQLGEALFERSDEIMFIQAKNEQAAVHMAIGYYRQSGKIAAVTTSIGPGATNMVTGALVAKIGRFPVILLPGEAFENRSPRGPVLQEIEGDETANHALKPVSVFYRRLMRAENVLGLMRGAFLWANKPGLEGPAVIALPMDVQAEAFDYDLRLFGGYMDFDIPEKPDPVSIENATRALMTANRPLIIAGGGVLRSSGSAELLAKISMQLEIPVVHTQGGQGALLWNHPYNLFSCGPTGTPLGNKYAETADVVLAVGTRLDDFTTASETLFSETATFIGLNINRLDAGKAGAKIQIVSDANTALSLMYERVGRTRRIRKKDKIDAFNEEIAEARAEWLAEATRLRSLPANGEGLLPQSSVIGIINDVLDDGAVIVAAAGSIPGDLLTLWRCKDITRKGYHVEYDASTMGYEIPGAIGVKLASPKRQVVALLGDGSFLMNPTEILTAVQERLAVTFVVFDSRGHRSIQGCQEGNSFQKFGTEYRMRNGETGLLDGDALPFDLVAIARGLGAEVLLAESEKQITLALERAKEVTEGPCVIVIPIDSERTVPNYSFWDVPIPEVAERSEFAQARIEYEGNLARRVAR